MTTDRRCYGTGKLVFETEGAALAELVGITRLALRGERGLRDRALDKPRLECRAYECRDCHGFHLSSEERDGRLVSRLS